MSTMALGAAKLVKGGTGEVVVYYSVPYVPIWRVGRYLNFRRSYKALRKEQGRVDRAYAESPGHPLLSRRHRTWRW